MPSAPSLITFLTCLPPSYADGTTLALEVLPLSYLSFILMLVEESVTCRWEVYLELGRLTLS